MPSPIYGHGKPSSLRTTKKSPVLRQVRGTRRSGPRCGATPPSGIPVDDMEEDDPPADGSNTCCQPQKRASPENSDPQRSSVIDHARDSDRASSAMQHDMREHDNDYTRCLHEPIIRIEEAYDDSGTDSTPSTLDERASGRRDVILQPPLHASPRPKRYTESLIGQCKRQPNTPYDLEPAKRTRMSLSDARQLQFLAKACRTIKDIATLDNVKFVQERLALLRALDASQGRFVADTSQHDPPLPAWCGQRHLERLRVYIGFS